LPLLRNNGNFFLDRGEAQMICLVQARETIQIPPESQFFIPVTIPTIECLSRYGYKFPERH
jgi:hypothetical protein